MKTNELYQHLAAKVQQLYAQYKPQHNKKIYAVFDRTLFTEDFQPLQFYLKEIEQTLQKIAGSDVQDIERCQFYCNKLLAQCQALNDSLHRPSKPTKQPLSASIHQLPQRERLAAYYEALQALNEKLSAQQDQLKQNTNAHQAILYQQQIDITHQRIARCIEAIEQLESELN